MASAKTNATFNFQFSLLLGDDYTRLPGEVDGDFAAELWVDDADGLRVLCDPLDGDLPDWQRVAVVVAELPPLVGEYAATFTPVAPRHHHIVVRHGGTSRHHALDVRVTTADETDVSLTIGGSITGLPG